MRGRRWHNTVTDPGFSLGVGVSGLTPKVGVLTYYFAIFGQKLHENERIWIPRGAPGMCQCNIVDSMANRVDLHDLGIG